MHTGMKESSSRAEDDPANRTEIVAAVELDCPNRKTHATTNVADTRTTVPTAVADPASPHGTLEDAVMTAVTVVTAHAALRAETTRTTMADVVASPVGNTAYHASHHQRLHKHLRWSTTSQAHHGRRETTKLRCKCRNDGA
jgi:hypothetical protein